MTSAQFLFIFVFFSFPGGFANEKYLRILVLMENIFKV
jgi:hypothetical protein